MFVSAETEEVTALQHETFDTGPRGQGPRQGGRENGFHMKRQDAEVSTLMVSSHYASGILILIMLEIKNHPQP